MTGAAAALTLAAALIPAHSAMAAVTTSFDPSVVSPGGTTVVTGSGCPVAGEVIVNTWITTFPAPTTLKTATVTADAVGDFSATVAVHGAPGELPEIAPPSSQFGISVECGGVHTVVGFGALSYAGAPLTLTLSPAVSVVPGDDVTISGTGCDAGESVFIAASFSGSTTTYAADTTADASGDFTFVVPTPPDGLAGGILAFEVSCGAPAPEAAPEDTVRRTLVYGDAPVGPEDPADPVVPADPDPGAAPAATDPTQLPTARRTTLAATGPDVGSGGMALVFLLAGATLIALRRSRWNVDPADRTPRSTR
jgi:hypothetical protein